MEVKTKFFITNSRHDEQELQINKIYEFQESNFMPRTGRLISIKGNEITFDCSSEYYSNIVTFEIHRIFIIKEVK